MRRLPLVDACLWDHHHYHHHHHRHHHHTSQNPSGSHHKIMCNGEVRLLMETILPMRMPGLHLPRVRAPACVWCMLQPPHPIAMLPLAKFLPLASPPPVEPAPTNIALGCGVDMCCSPHAPLHRLFAPLAKFLPSTDSRAFLQWNQA